MPGHEKHREESIRWFSVFASLVAIFTIFFLQSIYVVLIIPILTMITYPVVRAGAMFPDIDIASSNPYSALMFSIPVLSVLTAIAMYIKRSSLNLRSIPKIIFVAILGYIASRIVRTIIKGLLNKTKHRGVTHRASTGGVIGLGLAAFVHNLLRNTILHSFRFVLSPIVAVSFFIGHLSHLILDQKNAKDGYRFTF
jgi:hypothetical protein